jgi:Yip1 domain
MGTASHPPFTPNATGTRPAPAPLDELLRMLPDQYVQVLTQPAPATLAAQVEHADWRVIWIQLLGWSIASAVFGFFSRLLTQMPPIVLGGQYLSPAARQALVQAPAESFGAIIGVPLGFFISMGILYVMGRLLGGQGTFLAQSYVSSLFLAPLGVSSVVGIVPVFGALVAFAAFLF